MHSLTIVYFIGYRRVYFLDRLSSNLYTLALDQDFNNVVCNMLTGMTPVTGTIKQMPLNYSLVQADKIPLYGQVNHYHSFENAPYKPVDEILYVVQNDEIFRQVLILLHRSASFIDFLVCVCVCVCVCAGTIVRRAFHVKGHAIPRSPIQPRSVFQT